MATWETSDDTEPGQGDEFLSFVSHQLRSPLNAIRGWAHLLRKAGPLAATQVQALDAIERSVSTQARLIDDLLDGSRLRHGGPAKSRQQLEAPAPNPSRPRVLVVEDEDDTRRLLEQLLSEGGFEPVAFACAADAFNFLEGLPAGSAPRLIVSDIGMPDEDGYSFIRRTHALHADRNELAPPAIAVTGFTSETARRRALDAGFEAHLAKPVDPRELQSTLERLLQPGRMQPVP